MMMMMMMMSVMITSCAENDSLLASCCNLESRLDERRAELERITVVHARYREKMSQHRQLVESVETSQTSTLQTDELRDMIDRLTTES